MAIDIFVQISALIITALVVSFIMRLLKQPLIIGYIITGIIVSPFFLKLAETSDTVSIFSKTGVALLLFIVGLHLNPRVIKECGKASLVAGFVQMALTALAGFFLARFLGFSVVYSWYIAAALTFSSTIIIMKIFSDNQELDTLHGKISVGILILQDIAAILLLMALPYFSNGLNISLDSIIYGFISMLVLFFASVFVLPALVKFTARSQEFLFLFSLGWCFALAALFYYLGFSMEIGALLAGISLSVSPYQAEISSKIRPLRDFFLILFFIFLGLKLQIGSISGIIKPAIIFSVFVLLFKLFSIMIPLGVLGYSKRTSFYTGISLGQISEFSFILIAFGISLGHLSSDILPLITLVGLITITSSSYLMTFLDGVYPYFSNALKIFERKRLINEKRRIGKVDSVLFGYNRIGFNIEKSLRKLKGNHIIVDFNPETARKLRKKNINCIYGDADDSEFLEELNLDKIEIAVSTIPLFETNLLITKKIRRRNRDAVVIMLAHQIDEAFELYRAGADYIILPHFLGGNYISSLIENFRTNKQLYRSEKLKQIQDLKERLKEGHKHPRVERG